MSDTYTKLFRSIAGSTIVSEPVDTRWLWVMMLSQADKSGYVYASIPGLARFANLTIPETEAGLQCFLSPDPYSRTPDHEGRRIEVVDGGWRLLNHAKYDEMRNSIERAEYKRQWDRENRPSGHQRRKVRQQSDKEQGKSDKADGESDIDPTQSCQSGPTSHFSLLNSEPNGSDAGASPKVDSPPADPIWGTGLAFLIRKNIPEKQARSLLGKLKQACGDIQAGALLAEAEAQDITDPAPWLMAAASKRARAGPGAPQQMGKQAQGLMALEAMKSGNRMAPGRTANGVPEALLLGVEPNPGR